jgi:dolichol-phosphate mannosyltransferase
MANSVSVVIPAYKEFENLPKLINRVALLRAQLNPLEIIIVDDDSKDGTFTYLGKLQRDNDWIKFIFRKNQRGLSSAVIEGFKQARYSILVCMDADLSHPPEIIPQMVEAISKPNVDFVIGSRFVKGGSVPDTWSFSRWLNTIVARCFARLFTNAKDPMSGFFCLKQSTFKQADKLNPIGYKIGLELIVKCHCKNIVEIPIHFAKRFKGKSKLSLREMINYLIHIKRLVGFRYLRAVDDRKK